MYNGNKMTEIPSLLWKAHGINDKYGYLHDGELALVEGGLAHAQGNYRGSIDIYDRYLNEADTENMPLMLRARMLTYKAWSLISDSKYTEAIETAREALDLIRRCGYESLSLPLISGISYCYEHLGRYKEAYNYLKNYQQRVDSMWISEQFNNLAQLRIESLVRLNESKITRQQEELKARRRHIIILMCIGIVLLSVIILLWRLYRQKEGLIKSIVAREKESLVREKLLRQAVEQAKAEAAVANDKASASIDEEKAENLMVRFNELMSEKRLYTDSSLSIKSVAELMETNRTYLSQAINRTFGKSFPQVLAEYRVRAAIEMMSSPDCNLPLKAIASEVGFSSASAFFTTFRNVVGMTPSAYRAQQGTT
ncbi:MAG: AraC family transcriptional regulator, partial [Duncaniella sp.]|nr:AraC family transcriptional regulator [Duncaniella sp.]